MSSNVYNDLNVAIRNSDLERVKSILRTAGDVNMITKDFRGKRSTFLHLAPNVDITRELLLRGAHVNAVDDYNLTPLHYAVTYCKGLGVIRELLSHGAEINAQNHEGFTALTFAILFGNLDVIAELMKYDADFDLPIASSYFQYSTSLGIAITDYENSAKLIIKMSLLKRVCDDVHQPINLNPYQQCPNFKILSTYQDKCIKELTQMKLYDINDRFSLYEFVMNKSNFIKPLYSCNNLILEDISSNFPIYCNMILPRMKLCLERAHLLDRLRSLRIFVNLFRTDKKQIIVDPDSMYKIGEYLSNGDMKNYITAYETCPVKPNYFMKLIPLPDIVSDEPLGGDAKRCKISVD